MELPPTSIWDTVKQLEQSPVDHSLVIEYFKTYSAIGISCFPIVDEVKTPFRGTHGRLDATTDLDEFLKILESAAQKAGLGIRMGDKLGEWGGYLVALDVDVKKGKNGFDTLTQHRLEPTDTMTARTRSGGAHYLYRSPKPLQTKTAWLGVDSGLDIRGANGCLSVEPTSGHTWDRDIALGNISMAPDWLVKMAPKSTGRKSVIEEVEEQKTVPCPLHTDKRPSCWIRKHENGHYTVHCFSCGKDPHAAQALGFIFAGTRKLQSGIRVAEYNPPVTLSGSGSVAVTVNPETGEVVR